MPKTAEETFLWQGIQGGLSAFAGSRMTYSSCVTKPVAPNKEAALFPPHRQRIGWRTRNDIPQSPANTATIMASTVKSLRRVHEAHHGRASAIADDTTYDADRLVVPGTPRMR